MARPLTAYAGKRLLLLIPTLLGVSVLTFLRGRLQWPEAQRYYQVETLIFGRAVERAMHPVGRDFRAFVLSLDRHRTVLPRARRKRALSRRARSPSARGA